MEEEVRQNNVMTPVLKRVGQPLGGKMDISVGQIKGYCMECMQLPLCDIQGIWLGERGRVKDER